MPSRRITMLLGLLAAGLAAGCSRSGEEPPDGKPAEAGAAVRPAAIVAGVPAPRPTGPVPAGTSCVSSGCHASFATAQYVHGVLWSDDNCGICHDEDQGGHVYPLKRPGNETCTFCHRDITGRREHPHAAAEVGCLTCHDAHASEHRSLLLTSTAALCSSCHPPESHAHLHAPFGAGECVACHEPHESDFGGLLRGGEGAEHCFLCHEATHDAMATASHVHAPAAADCRICHDPHGSDHPHALTADIDAGCFSCHADIERTIEGAEAPHGALSLGEQCANCHDPHASDRPALLKDRQDVLCLQCHGETITAKDGRTIPNMAETIRERAFLHGPVKSGDCSACHNIHGGSHAALLREHFEESFYASFDLKHYALCFECHESELVTEERTDALTDFRDGDLNLHYLHVHRDKKGRTCRACHEMHGSNLPAHVAETVPFEKSAWALPIGFEQTATGGSCAPGCHKPMKYDRVEPIGWPTEQPPSQDNPGDTR